MRKLIILDIGARGATPKELKILSKYVDNGIQIHTFELDPKSEFLEDKIFEYINHKCGLWSSKKTLDFFITSEPSMSSCYRPNSKIKKFEKKNYDKRLTWEKISIDQVSTLDEEFSPGESIDFIKCDTQGAEYEISKGGIKLLEESCPIVALETWSEEVYESVPLDFEIMKLYHEIGYVLFHKDSAGGYWKFDTEGKFARSQGKFTGDNLLFLPSIELLSKLSKEDLTAKLIVMSYFRFYDYSFYVLKNLEKMDLLPIIENIYKSNENMRSDIYRKISRLMYESRKVKNTLKLIGINTTPKIT